MFVSAVFYIIKAHTKKNSNFQFMPNNDVISTDPELATGTREKPEC